VDSPNSAPPVCTRRMSPALIAVYDLMYNRPYVCRARLCYKSRGFMHGARSLTRSPARNWEVACPSARLTRYYAHVRCVRYPLSVRTRDPAEGNQGENEHVYSRAQSPAAFGEARGYTRAAAIPIWTTGEHCLHARDYSSALTDRRTDEQREREREREREIGSSRAETAEWL